MIALFEALRIGARGLTVNKVRSALTMLGIIIGVAAVIALVSVGQGFSAYVDNQFAGLGTNVLSISRSRGVDNPQQLTTADAAALADPLSVHGVLAVAAVYQGSVTASYSNLSTSTEANGVTPEYLTVLSYQVSAGRFITSDDDDRRAKVVVLGHTVAEALFPDDPYPIGQTIRLNSGAFEVIGVLAEKGGSGPSNSDDVVLVPLSTAQTRLFSVETVRGEYVVSQISVQAASKEAASAAEAEITTVLRAQHRLAAGDTDDFNIFNQADLVSTMSSVTGTLTLFLGAVAAISLLVGGIGIMNIMLVSVTERTREIGLRKAIGGGRSDILMQFLTEAMALSLLGGLVGVGLGAAAARLIGPLLGVQSVVTATSVALAVGFSATIGIVFGIYPAMRAAALQPIVALRSN